jgi:DAACS family dicarboxylate/amino acid:cation (Na+ or H+) symporter
MTPLPTGEGRTALQILLGMILGGALGLTVHGTAGAAIVPWTDTVGTVFLRLLLLCVIPLASTALVLGFAEVKGGVGGRLGRRIAGWTVALSSAAVFLGAGLLWLVHPGRGLDPSSLPTGSGPSPAPVEAKALLLGMIPGNLVQAMAEGNLMAVLVGASVFGLALRQLDGEAGTAARRLVESLFAWCAAAVRMVMTLAPVGVFALVATLFAKAGVDAVRPLLGYVGIVLLGLFLQSVAVYGAALRSAGRSPMAFFRGIRPALLLAFSTASSAATLPTSLRVAEDNLRLHPASSRLVLTIGATGNQNGTALFEGVTVLFLAELYGVELGFTQMLFVAAAAIVAGVGTAGVPGGALPVIAALLGQVGVPPEAIGVIAGVDRLLDMCRTTVNVAGDLVIAAIVDEER